MQRAILRRLETGDQGTFGQLRLNDLTLFTGELPARENKNNVSCIPAGTYRCIFNMSRAFRRLMYLVDGVPGRSGVRIHSANYMGDEALGFRCQLKGCIAPGMKLGWMAGQKAVLSSAAAVAVLEAEANREPFDLEIIDEYS